MPDSRVPSVAELIRLRLDQKSVRRQRQDPYELALVIEGGGMRGVVAGGMVTAIQELGLAGCFDTIHGSSAGACAGAYLMADQARLGTSIYFEDINNSKVTNPRRLWAGRAIMDTGFITDDVMRTTKRLDVDKIIATPDQLHIIATSTTAEELHYSRYADPNEFFAILRGTITMPIVGGRSVNVGGHELVDGGMVQQIPFRSAVENGATHVLILLTRRDHELERKKSRPLVILETLAMRLVYGRRLARLYRSRRDRINNELKLIFASTIGNVTMDYIARPGTASRVRRFSLETDVLKKGAEEGYDAIRRYVGALPAASPFAKAQ
jgi:predicted patatin/cPLA2 family phospholipase